MLNPEKIINYYSKKSIQKSILEHSEDREVGIMFLKGFFGKRPDVLQFETDVLDLVKKGASSFHVSEERWFNPLNLSTGISIKELNSLRKGWDLILDIDTPYWDYAKYTTYLIVEFLKSYDIKNIGVKFSGNKGFHISVPFESFPETVHKNSIKDLYPESPRIVAAYISHKIKNHLSDYILKSTDLSSLIKYSKVKREDLFENGVFNPYRLVEIDTLLISSRHLFRAPYSLHEKSGLVSVPITPDQILRFNKLDARPENVVGGKKFLLGDLVEEKEAKDLFVQAFDWYSMQKKDQHKKEENKKNVKSFEIESFDNAISEEFFPPCIKNILKGGLEDGKKRSLFVLLRFLKLAGWSWDKIIPFLKEWDKKNKESLGNGYITSQINWHKRQKELVLVPNCKNENYYKDLGVCKPDQTCNKINNPYQYIKKKLYINKKKS